MIHKATLTMFHQLILLSLLCIITPKQIIGFSFIYTPSHSSWIHRSRISQQHKQQSSNSNSNSIVPNKIHNNNIMSSLSMVAIGLGPGKENKDTDDKALVEGIDYIVPNHDEYRLSRRSKLDEQCDIWFEKLLYNNNDNTNINKKSITTGSLHTSITDRIIQQLIEPVVLTNDIGRDRATDIEWTPYSKEKLPWTTLLPSYGLEQFGIPIPRRNSEQWKNFDLPSIISIDYSGMPCPTSYLNNENNNKVFSILNQLINLGIWIHDDMCDARLIYVNGKFCNELSKSNTYACNLNSAHYDNDVVTKYLSRLTDGYTDELVHPVSIGIGEPTLTLQSKLSTPNHNIGLPTTQFAMNTQQGTACFAALNTIKCEDVAYIHVKKDNMVNTTTKKSIISIVNVVTKHIDILGDDNKDDHEKPVGVTIHPRALVIAEEDANLSIIQNCIDLDYNDKDKENDTKMHTPKLVNGYTQFFIEKNANVTHTYINECGGDYYFTENEEDNENNDNNIDIMNRNRQELQDTVFETIDVHINGGNYDNVNIIFPSCGKTKIAQSITLLQDESTCILNGLSISGNNCKQDIKTNIHHIGSACISKQLQKNLLGGKRSTTSFRGRIRVEQNAQQTLSNQLSRTILLNNNDCRAWNVPSLEIIADDVQCTHGTTISDLSEEQLFYLHSRGISSIDSRNLLMYAFCEDIIQKINPIPITNGNDNNEYNNNNNNDNIIVYNNKLQERINQRLKQLVPRGPRAMKGEYQSV